MLGTLAPLPVRRRPPAWLAYLGCALAGTAAYFLLPWGASASGVFLAVALAAAAAVTVGARRARARTGWGLIAAGVGLTAAGDAAWSATIEWPGAEPAAVTAPDALYLAAYPFFLAGLGLLVRATARGRMRAAAIDAAAVGIAVGSVVWLGLVHPALEETGGSALARAVTVAYPALDVVLLGFAALLLLAPGARAQPARLLALAFGALLGADLLWRHAALSGGYAVGDVLDLGYLLAYAAWGAAALHPAARRGPPARLGPAPALTRARLALLVGVALAMPAWLVREGVSLAEPHVVAAIAVGAAVVPLFVLVRLALLVRVVEGIADSARAAQRRLEAVIDASPLPIAIVDASGRVTLCNRAAADAGGTTCPQPGGDPLPPVAPESRPRGDDLVARVLRGEEARGAELAARAGGPGPRVWSVSGAPLRERDGTISGAILISADVTERVRAVEALRRKEAILEAVGFAAETMLRAPAWQERIGDVLERLGRAASATVVYLYENEAPAPGGAVRAVLRAEWARSEGERLSARPGFAELALSPGPLERWAQAMARGEIVDARLSRVKAPGRALLEAAGVRASITVPISVEGSWWGFIGLSDADEERAWSPGEKEALRGAADALGAALGRVRAEAELRSTTRTLEAIVARSPLPIAVVDADGTIRLWNPAAEALSGWTASEVVGHPAPIVPAREPRRVAKLVSRALAGEQLEDVEVALRTKEGTPMELSVFTAPIHDGGERPLSIVAIWSDVTERRRAEEQIRFLAGHDHVTGLPNRRTFEAHLEQAVRRARRGPASALLLLDLDDFKRVNDTAGHPAGDRFLVELTRALRQALRPGDFLARVGGDEFAAILDRVSTTEAREVAERVAASARALRFVDGGRAVATSVSVGAAPIDGTSSPDDVVARADAALYEAKELGKGRVVA